MNLSDYLRVLRLRWRFVAAAVVLVPIIAVALSLRQDKEYTSHSSVLLGRQDVSALITGRSNDPAATIGQGGQFTATQSSLATVRPVLDRVIDAVKPGPVYAQQFRDSAAANPRRSTDLLDLEVTVGDPNVARTLATEWARQFIIYRNSIDTSSLQKSADAARDRLAALQREGRQGSALYTDIEDSLQQLRGLIALSASNVTLVAPARDAPQSAPRPKVALILGLVLGLALGIALALLRHATDTRTRSSEEIEEALDVPVLGQLVAPRDPTDPLVLDDPVGPMAEAHRLLALNVRLANVHTKARIIMFSSAIQGEGKSTTVANTAITLARAGHSVVVVDLDLHRPTIGRLFGARGHGVTDVALGSRKLDEVLRRIDVGDTSAGSTGGGSPGSLSVLSTGPLPPSPAQFVAGEGVTHILRELAARYDYVLVDAPPMLGLSDAVSLATESVDAIVIVSRLKLLRRRALNDLTKLIERIETPLLGVVVTGAQHEVLAEYAYESQAPELDQLEQPPVRHVDDVRAASTPR